jgi:hypothetical protein
MNNYRLFLLNFVMVSFFLLTGFQTPSVNHASLVKKQVAPGNVKTAQFKAKKNFVNQREKKDKRWVATANNTGKDADLQKSLDLSIPFKASENDWLKAEQNRIAKRESLTVFAGEKKKSQSVHLDGEMLMSQEPEMDKQKSLDGAGIVITLKR